MKQLGILTPALDMSQQGLCITHNLNLLVQNYQVSPTVFFREYAPFPEARLFSLMQEVEVFDFPHPVIATSLDSATRLLACPSPTKKFLYCMNLDWVYLDNLNHEQLSNIYNSEIELIARSEEHAYVLESCWKKPIAIIEDFYYEDIYNVTIN
jgi:hypothetical protein